MSELQQYRIEELENEVEKLKAELDTLKAFNNQLLGMGNAAKWGMRILFALGGTGIISILYQLNRWLNAPMKVH